jgi:TetR/AcrR family transcriptional regulator
MMKFFKPRVRTEVRREQLVAATLHLLAHTSLEALSTRQLAAELGLSQPALFRHFPSREALLLETVAQVRSEVGAIALAIVESQLPAIEQLRTLGLRLLEHVENRPGIARLLFAMGTPSAGAIREALQHVVAMQTALVLELVRQGQAAGDLNGNQDADAAAMLFVGVVQGLVLRWEIAGRDHPLAARFEPVFLVWLHGAGPKRADGEGVEAEPTDASVQTAPMNEAGKSVPLAMLDVRPLIARGVDPLSAILAQLEELPSSGALVVQAPFRPSPLLSLLSRRGHGVSAEALSEKHWAVEVVVGGALTIDDLRDFEPPEPMERVLSAVALLAPGGAYLARLPRHPELLLPKLLERGLMVQVAPRGDGSTLLRVEKRA